MSRKPIPLPSREKLRSLFDYDETTGVLTRRPQSDVPHWINSRFSGKPTGSVAESGHLVVNIGYQRFYAHRIVWKWLYGTEPTEVDHENLNGSDNRKSNLRIGSHSQNTSNAKSRKVINTHLPKGVYPTKSGKKFTAHIASNRTQFYLGTFTTPEEAHAAYSKAALRLHGEFARTE